MSTAEVADYASSLDAQRAQICNALQRSIDASLPQASSRLWHAIPVWFIGENPVVGYTARKTGVMLMFWNGQHFDEPELAPTGSFHMAQIACNDVSEIDEAKLSRWLAKAGTSIWDMVGERNSVVAERRTTRAKAKKAPKKKASKPAGKVKSASKAKAAKSSSKAKTAKKAEAAKRKPAKAKARRKR
jgi:Domain of unknown function (DU1801)